MKQVVFALSCLLAAGVGAKAAELQPAHVAKGAKWVLHLDWEAMSDSGLVERYHSEYPSRVTKAHRWLKTRYGIDAEEDLKSITLYGNNFKPHTGVVILHSRYDKRKAQSLLEKKADKTTEWEGYQLYTIKKGGHGDHAAKQPHDKATARRKADHCESDHESGDACEAHHANKTSGAAAKPAHEPSEDSPAVEADGGTEAHEATEHKAKKQDAKQKEHDAKIQKAKHRRVEPAKHTAGGDKRAHAGRHGKNKRQHKLVLVLYDDSTVVMGSSANLVREEIKVLKGESPSLKDADSKLTADVPEGTIVYGAAVGLNKLGEHGRPFPLLSKLEQAAWAVGERDDRLFEEVTVVGRDEDTAAQVQQIIEGLIALGKVVFADAESVTKLYDAVEFSHDGQTLKVQWEGNVDEVWTALEEVKPLLKKWHKAHHSKMKQ